MMRFETWMLFVIFVPFIALGLFFIFMGLTAPQGALDDGGHPMSYSLLAGGAFISISVFLGGGLFFYNKGIRDREKRIREKGIHGSAEVLSMEQTGSFINHQPVVIFRLLVTVQNRKPYEVRFKEILNLLDIGRVTEGSVIQVLVHPEKPEYILFG
ncbi:MAG: hypothetical protein JW904_10440 [Spirochaetales bacterium]|nr:hypothetical protein [Spirochaetales bacterium]